jgi:hypothetical protein
VHSAAADRLDDVEDPLAVLEHVEDRRHGPHVLGEGAVPDQVARDAEELAQHHPDDPRTGRHLDGGQPLHRQQVGEVVHDPAQVVDPVGVRDVGVPALALPHLLGAPVVEADLRHDVEDPLAVELEHQAQHAVGARVLGADVEEQEVRVLPAPLEPPLLGPEAEGLLLGDLLRLGQLVGPQLGRPRRVFLAQRVAVPGAGHEQALEVGVAVEAETEHVPRLALVPIGVRPQTCDGGKRRGLPQKRHLDPEVRVALEGEELIDDGEVRSRLPRPPLPLPLVDGGQIEQHPKRSRNLFLEPPQHRRRRVGRDPDRRHVIRGFLGTENVVAEGFFDLGGKVGNPAHPPTPLPSGGAHRPNRRPRRSLHSPPPAAGARRRNRR